MNQYDQEVLRARLAMMRARAEEIDKALPAIGNDYARQEMNAELRAISALIADVSQQLSPQALAEAEAKAKRRRDWLIAEEAKAVREALATAARFRSEGEHRQSCVWALSAWAAHRQVLAALPGWVR